MITHTATSPLGVLVSAWDLRPDVRRCRDRTRGALYHGRDSTPAVPPSGRRRWRTALDLAGLLAIVLALLSPIDALASRLFAMDMIQHVLLMMVAPPLLLLANPFSAVFRAMTKSLRLRIARLLTPCTHV